MADEPRSDSKLEDTTKPEETLEKTPQPAENACNSSDSGAGISGDATCPNGSDDTWFLSCAEGIVGPFSIPQLQQKYQLDELDGMTPTWREGMDSWLQVGEIPELKEKLQHASVPRPAISDVPMHHTFTDDSGHLHIFDISVNTWTLAEDYERLLRIDGNTDGLISPKNDRRNKRVRNKDKAVKDGLSDHSEEKRQKLDGILTELGEDAVDSLPGETTDALANAKKQKRAAYRERKKLKQKAGIWGQAKSNPNCYVSGLPVDVTEDELITLFTRSGVIKIDPLTGKPKVKLYRDATSNISKGDALVTFARPESVELAVKFLNEHEIRPQTTICVQQAQFEEKQQETLTKDELINKAAAKKNERKRYAAAKTEVGMRMDWGDGEAVTARAKKCKPKKVIVLRGMFGEDEARTWSSGDYDSLIEEIREECTKFGQVHKVVPIHRHPEGIVCIKFKDQTSCEACLQVMNGRKFDGRTVVAHFHAGTDFTAFMDAMPREAARRSSVSPKNQATSPKAPETPKSPSDDAERPIASPTKASSKQRSASWNELLEDTSSDEDMVIRTDDT